MLFNFKKLKLFICGQSLGKLDKHHFTEPKQAS